MFFFLLIISEYKKPPEKRVEKRPHFQMAFYIVNRTHGISL
ncbi:hypothetical protein NT05HA_1641 [Aggregatibacter aphrophilus NJ8700]|nr:hypothetical protein NT05HA_1641 [Aggregatibacter aphrophilus NJ8700]